MRQTNNRETINKTGDYVLPLTIEHEMERDKRHFDQSFFDKQYELELQKQAKLYELAYQQELIEELDLQSKSHICPGSQKIMSNYNWGPVFERLHDLSKQMASRQEAFKMLAEDPEATFQP